MEVWTDNIYVSNQSMAFTMSIFTKLEITPPMLVDISRVKFY